MRGESWTIERVALLRKLWSEGQTAVAIGARLGGLSRSAVLGKIFRLRLPPPVAAEGADAIPNDRAEERTKQGAAPARRRRRQTRQKPPPPSPTVVRGKTLLDLTNTSCRSAS